MNAFETDLVENEETDGEERDRWVRVAFSLFFALFAYLGLSLGGNLGTGLSAASSSFSSGRENQPLHLANRDIARGILAAERSALPKSVWHDAGPMAPAAFPPAAEGQPALPTSVAANVTGEFPVAHGYRPRGPPRPAAS